LSDEPASYPADVVVRSSAAARVLERIGDVAQTSMDAKGLRLQLLQEIARVADFDAYAWLLTDPQTSVGVAPLADVPCLPELPRLIRLKYLTEVNRWTGLDQPPAASLHQATGGRLDESRQWREMVHDLGVRDIASVVFRDQFGCWAFLDLWRTGSSTPFSPPEVAFLADLAPLVTPALRGAVAGTFADIAVRQSRAAGPAVLLLSDDLAVHGQTPDTEAVLNALLPHQPDRAPIPAGAYNVAAQLLAVEAGVADQSPSARVHLASGRWVTLRAARIGGTGNGGSGGIAVTIEETTPDERLDLFGRANGLTAREGELLRLLATGADTRTTARSMSISEHTVQDHLKSIFARTAVDNRRTLLARATGSR
jgi:DNA-binding CsgD family transcriptional regulator